MVPNTFLIKKSVYKFPFCKPIEVIYIFDPRGPTIATMFVE